MENNNSSWPVLVFLIGLGGLLIIAINRLYDALVLGDRLLNAFALLIFGYIMMPIGFYYTMKSYKKKK